MHMVVCGSTAYSVGTVWRGKGDLYTPDARPALLVTPGLASLAGALLADTGTRSICNSFSTGWRNTEMGC